MIKVENISVMNLDNAMRGLRNPLNSWNKSDSFYCYLQECDECCYHETQEDDENKTICNSPIATNPKFFEIYPSHYEIGAEDLNLCQRMIKADNYLCGPNSKFMRQIFVSMDITAPAYFAAEFDTYKVGTTRNSCSFQHKGTAKEFERYDFSTDYMDDECIESLDKTIEQLNKLREKYLETKDYNIFLQIRQLLPMSYNYRFTWTANYGVLKNIYEQRKNHRIPEWKEFCKTLESMPYGKELIAYEGEE